MRRKYWVSAQLEVNKMLSEGVAFLCNQIKSNKIQIGLTAPSSSNHNTKLLEACRVVPLVATCRHFQKEFHKESIVLQPRNIININQFHTNPRQLIQPISSYFNNENIEINLNIFSQHSHKTTSHIQNSQTIKHHTREGIIEPSNSPWCS
ncbi:hypothetical protein PV326_004172 [Microctonus aethiopoides]|nr:hypothetical protein PV326_004172 [Microctonus aethiopoides]